MTFYFKLQFLRLKRLLAESGLPPAIGMILLVIGFVVGSMYLFYKVDFASWAYLAIALFAVAQAGNKSGTDQLLLLFTRKMYWNIRIRENLFIALPFALFLVAQVHYLTAAGLLALALSLAIVPFPNLLRFTFPTPFKWIPFELPAGFRKSWWIFAVAVFLLVKGIQVNNFGLSLAALVLSQLTMISFYALPEMIYYVWIYARRPGPFLFHKIRLAWLGLSLITVPLGLVVIFSFPEQLAVSAAILILGYLFVATMILAKYSAFPREMSVPQALLFGLSVWFPPMLLIMLPVFYQQAVRQLNAILP
ncbi:MAG: hypothetical protein R2806_01760 [Saprospiraceae bacterium]